MLNFSIFLYKKLSPAAPVTPPYSMYYIFRFWGKLKSLRKYMHFNIFERSNIFNIFLTFSIQILTFPFNNCFFAISKKNEVLPSSIILTVTLGRSWADHGQIMGRPWAIDSCKKILKISAFFDTVFSRKIMEICDFRTRLEQSVKLFLQTPCSSAYTHAAHAGEDVLSCGGVHE